VSKGELTRARILDQALVLASRLGLDGLTLGVLAESLGLSKSGLYAHFRSKEALVLAVLEHTLGCYREHARPYLEGKAHGLEELRAYLVAWLDWIASPALPAGCPILGASFELEDQAGPTRDRVVELHEGSRLGLKAMVLRAIAMGELSAELPVEQVLFELRGITLAFHLEYRLVRSPKARPMAEAALASLLDRYAVKLPADAVPRKARRHTQRTA
jgi:AcrR family transcriptional regulator